MGYPLFQPKAKGAAKGSPKPCKQEIGLLIQVTSAWFCAGAEFFGEGRCRVAPILGKHVGKCYMDPRRFMEYCKQMGWYAEIVED